MAEIKRRVMLVGRFGLGALECSYERAFKEIGCEVRRFDIAAWVQRYCRLGNVGRLFNTFVPVEPWIRKANREMVLEARRFRPDVFVVFGQNMVGSGSLAQVRAMLEVATAQIWPDTMINLTPALIASLPLYDLIATYSRSTVSCFERLGARRVEWVPLAADLHLHMVQPSVKNGKAELGADISFIGQWRPEREEAIEAVLSHLPDVKLKIWGPDWGRRSRNPSVRRSCGNRSLYAEDFARAILSSKISLNVIDETNYPAANMRFFEIPCAGGVQVCSPCPEMETEFKHGETIFYYRDTGDLPTLVCSLLRDEELRRQVAHTAQSKVRKEHSYAHRAEQILKKL